MLSKCIFYFKISVFISEATLFEMSVCPKKYVNFSAAVKDRWLKH